MEYNFAHISLSSLAEIEKKLRKIKENALDDFNNFIHILNDEAVKARQGELNTIISDLFNDQINKTVIQFTECMNKLQSILKEYV